MENTSQDSVIRQSLFNSMDREELLMKKYEGYKPFVEDTETKDLLKEFQETALEHMDLLKSKLQNLHI